MNTRHLVWAVVSAFQLIPTSGRAEASGEILIVVEALSSNEGSVHCSLYASRDGFPSEPKKAQARAEAKPASRRARCAFRGVAPGRYAVAVWHDLDDDGKLDANFLGIPKEPVGASNDAKGRFGPPKFDDAAFELEPPRFEQTVRLD